MNRTDSPPRRRAHPTALLLSLLGLALSAGAGGPCAPALHAQAPDRAALLAEARGEFDDARALELLVRAADPTLAPPDSTWAVTLHDLAFTLVRLDREDAAELWLRWAARHASEWPLDREWFPPSVATLWDRARLDVRPGETNPGLESTTWDWRGASAAAATGEVRLTPGAAPPGARILLARPGEDAVAAEPGTAVEPGTYRVSVTAAGYEPVHLEREVLPGVGTLLEVDLAPSLSEASREAGRERSATIRWGNGAGACTLGVVVGDGRSVLTALRGLGSRSGLTVEAGEEHVFTNVPVVRTDERLGLALLRLEGDVPGLARSAPAVGSRHGWVATEAGCSDTGDEWTRLEAVGSNPEGLWALQPGVSTAALGAALLHPDEGLMGIVTQGDRAVPLTVAAPLIRGPFAAREDPVLGSTPTPQRSGLPWTWIGAGVGLAGIAAALAVRSGNEDGERTSRGTIVITFPGG